MGNYCRQKQQPELGRVLTPPCQVFIASSFASCQPASCVSGYDDRQWGAGRLLGVLGVAVACAAFCTSSSWRRFQCSQPDPLHLVLGEPLLRAVVQLGRARALVARNVWQPLGARSPSENRRR